jgi:predicted ATP-grasp superfamily ATP-dependent carboligase
VPVLVLDGHSRAAVETVQSLGRAGLEIDVASESSTCTAMCSRYPARKLVQPPVVASADFHAWLKTQDARRNYELIVPATEASLMALRRLDESDSLRQRAVLPGNDALDVALDKLKTWRLSRELGILAPNAVLVSEEPGPNASPNFPLVLKPVHSKVVVGGELQTVTAEVIRDQYTYQEQIREWLPHTAIVQQDYILGRGVGAEFLFDRGKKVWHFVHERVHEMPLFGGASSYRRSLPPIPALLADAEKILTALRWHGVAMVEFRVDAQGRHWLLEINPRLWGSLALAIDAGVDFPLGLWLLAQARKPPEQPSYRAYYYTRDLKNDLEWFKANFRADHTDSLLLTRSIWSSVIETLRPLAGRESWDHFDFHDLALTRMVLKEIVGEQARLLYRKTFGAIKSMLVRQHRLRC